MKNEEFYIGWMKEAPDGFARYVKKLIIVLLAIVTGTAIVLSLQQRRFSTATFEYGQLTTVTGTYQSFPVPSVKVYTRPDFGGNSSFITLPLVGYGKSGAEGIIASLEKEKGISLNNREVVFKGTLIFSDGKTLLQIDKNDQPLLQTGELKKNKVAVTDWGTRMLTGEIIDPKCYFGVMKPGHGKPHRDCAARCIAGGIPPVFYVRNEKGEANYYLILDENGKKISNRIKDHIAEPVSLEARIVQYDDWIVLYVKDKTIKRTGGLSWFKSPGITCGNPG